MAVLAGRVAVVTGASVGIGAGLAAMRAAEGAKVVLAARRERELAGVADGIRQRGGVAIPVLADLTSDESIARLLETAQAEAGPVDVLVNTSGSVVWKPLEETALAEWDHAFAVNVRAAACLSAGVLPGMQARRFGRIINIGSEAGVAIVPGLAAYCVSKHALVALTEVIQDGNHDNGIKAWGHLSRVRRHGHGLRRPRRRPGQLPDGGGGGRRGPLPAAHWRQREARPADSAAHHAQPHGGLAHGTVMTGIAELQAQALDATGRVLRGVPADCSACRYPGACWDALSEQNGQFRRGPDTAC